MFRGSTLKKRGRDDSPQSDSLDSTLSKPSKKRTATRKYASILSPSHREKTPTEKIRGFIQQMYPLTFNPLVQMHQEIPGIMQSTIPAKGRVPSGTRPGESTLNAYENLGTHISNYDSSVAYGDVFFKYLLRKYNYPGTVKRHKINIASNYGMSRGFSHALVQNQKEIDPIVEDIVELLAKESIGGKGGIIEITIVFNQSLSDAHINLIFVKNGKVEHFEPHGIFLSTNTDESKYKSIYIRRTLDQISAKIEAYTEGQIRMQGVSDCSAGGMGCQTLENAASLIRRPEIEDDGYCTLWAMFFIELWFITKLKIRDIVKIVFQYLGEKACTVLSTMHNPKLPKTHKALDAIFIRHNRGNNQRTKAIELNRFMQTCLTELHQSPGASDNAIMDKVLRGEESASLLVYNIEDYPHVYVQKLREVRNYLDGTQLKMGLEPVPKLQAKMVEDAQIIGIVKPILGNMYLELIRCYAGLVETKMKKHILPKLENIREEPYVFREFVDEIDRQVDLSPDLVRLTPVSTVSTPVSLSELSGFERIRV